MLAFPRKHIYPSMEIQRIIHFFFYHKARAISQAIIVYLFSFFFLFFSLSSEIIIRSFLFRPTENQCVLISNYTDCANEQSKRWRETANLKPLETRLSWTSRSDNAHFSRYVSFQLFDKFFTNSNPMEIRINAHWVNARATVSKERREVEREREKDRFY